MNTYIGIDLGTGSVKLLLVDGEGRILAEAAESYEVHSPKSGWTEQDPSDWLRAMEKGMADLLAGQESGAVRGISFSGQMHGLVVLDKNDTVIRPCILWNDARTAAQTAYLNEKIGRAKLSEWTGNVAFAGFTAPKLLWMRQNEPEKFGKIAKIMLPKDYLVYHLTGRFVTDFSDASGTLLLDVKTRTWSLPMMVLCGVSEKQLPTLHESYGAVGKLRADWADKFGLPRDVVIAAGAGDNAAAAVGTGTVQNGACNISLGTSGTIFLSSDVYTVDEKNSLHSFCHANGHYHLMGCILSAAFCRKWWLEEILGSTDYPADDRAIATASDTDELLFLPYLAGERSPHNNLNARGAFIGLSSTTTKAQMSRAILEGVTFALRDCLEAAKKNGVFPTSAGLCGGGAKSRIWRQIVADILGIPIHILSTEQGPAFGAAILAMVACGEYDTIAEATERLVHVTETVLPFAANTEKYESRYARFRELYSVLWAPKN